MSSLVVWLYFSLLNWIYVLNELLQRVFPVYILMNSLHVVFFPACLRMVQWSGLFRGVCGTEKTSMVRRWKVTGFRHGSAGSSLALPCVSVSPPLRLPFLLFLFVSSSLSLFLFLYVWSYLCTPPSLSICRFLVASTLRIQKNSYRQRES